MLVAIPIYGREAMKNDEKQLPVSAFVPDQVTVVSSFDRQMRT